MKTQHTPGPWHVGMKPGPVVYGPKGEQVAEPRSMMLDRAEISANARLIAASPEMFDELHAVLPFLEDMLDDPCYKNGTVKARIKAVNDLLSKAKG